MRGWLWSVEVQIREEVNQSINQSIICINSLERSKEENWYGYSISIGSFYIRRHPIFVSN